jgi:hypothetical protein
LLTTITGNAKQLGCLVSVSAEVTIINGTGVKTSENAWAER